MKGRLGAPAGPTLIALLTVYLVWGSTYLALEVALRTLPPFLLTTIRFALAGGALLVIGRLRGEAMPDGRQWRNAFIVGSGLLGVTYAAGTLAQLHVSSSLAAILYATEPVWLVIFSMFAGQRPARGEWIGIALGLAGIALLNQDEQLAGAAVGIALLLASAANWALWSILGRRFDTAGGATGSGAQLVAGSTSMLALSLVCGERISAPITAESLAVLGYLALIGTMSAFVAYAYLLKHTRPAVAVSYAYVNPLVAVLLGVALGGETLTWPMVAALGLILAGVVFMVARPRPHGAAAGRPERSAKSTPEIVEISDGLPG